MPEPSAQRPLAVITGGNGTLAQAIAAALKRPDWQVETPSRSSLDVCSRDAVTDYFAHRRVALLVCNAGVTRDTLLARMQPADWEAVWEVNLRGALHCARAAAPGMQALGHGHIVFLSSYSALHPPLGQVAYATAKATLLGLTTDLAAEWGAANIRVNAILPGFLETSMTANVSAQRREEVRSAHALKRFNTCHAAAEMIAFLHHSLPHTSGQIFQLDSRLPSPPAVTLVNSEPRPGADMNL